MPSAIELHPPRTDKSPSATAENVRFARRHSFWSSFEVWRHVIALQEVPLADPCHDREFLDRWIQDFGTCAFSAADEMGLFDAFADGASTPDEVASRLELDAHAVAALCQALAALDALEVTDERWGLQESAQHFWLKRSPLYRGIEFDQHRDWEQHHRIVETLRNGWSPLEAIDQSFTKSWSEGQISAEAAENFTKVMHSMILTPSLAGVRSGIFRDVQRLVDVGGGSGALAAAVVAHHPACRATVMDLEPVCDASRKILSETSSGSSVDYFPANVFKDSWPSDVDAFVFSNILHDWPMDACQELLGTAYRALAPGGKLFVHEILLHDDRRSPTMAVLFDVLMRMNHRSQQFTYPELKRLLEGQGLTNTRLAHRYSYWSWIVAEKPSF